MHTYRPEYLTGLGVLAQHFQQVTRLASQVPIAQLGRPTEAYLLDELVALVTADLADARAASR